ncbi:MAG TPA: LytTR family DNA-binding domain-containing protein [Chitinophagaceae bacterium]
MRDFLFVKDGSKHVQVFFSQLQYIEAAHRYVRFVTADKVYTGEGPLYDVETALPVEQFCRIHKSYIISLLHTRHFDARTVMVGGCQLPIGRQYRGILPKKVNVVCGNAASAKK